MAARAAPLTPATIRLAGAHLWYNGAMHRFLSDSPLGEAREVTLSEEESHHLARVLRLSADAAVTVFDGRGAVAVGRIVSASPKGARIAIGPITRTAARSGVRLCFAIAKGPALEFIIRRGTEIGVAGFQPLGTRWSLKAKEWNEARWHRILVEVCKQCQDPWLPELAPARELSDWLASRETSRALVFCDEADRAADLGALSGGCDLLVGAEGGFSDEEREHLLAAGARRMGLGRNRLRAEMAAIAGTILLKHRLGEM